MNKWLLILFGVAFGAILFYFIKVNQKISQFYEKIYKPKNNHVRQEQLPSPEKTAFNILLLGYAGGNHEGAYLTDTVMVAHVDFKKKRVVLVSVPRDVWVKIPTKSGESFHGKINILYQMELFPKDYPDVASKNVVTRVVSSVTGLSIDYYALLDFVGFKQAIDVLGGVDIEVRRSFEDPRYPIEGKEKDLCGKDEPFAKIEKYLSEELSLSDEKESTLSAERDDLFKKNPDLETFFKDITDNPPAAFPCRYETIQFAAGPNHMDGDTALKFARSRNAPQDGGDFGRAKRQQQLIEAVKEQVLSIGFIPKAIPFLDSLEDHVATDIPLDQMKKFLAEANRGNDYKITNLVLTDNEYLKGTRSEDGQFILIPEEGEDRWGRVQRWIKSAIAGISPTPKKSSAP